MYIEYDPNNFEMCAKIMEDVSAALDRLDAYMLGDEDGARLDVDLSSGEGEISAYQPWVIAERGGEVYAAVTVCDGGAAGVRWDDCEGTAWYRGAGVTAIFEALGARLEADIRAGA